MTIENCTKPLAMQNKQYEDIAYEIQKIIDISTSGNSFFNLSDNSALLKVITNDITRVFAERFSGLLAFRNLILSSLLTLDKISPICNIVYLDHLSNKLLGKETPDIPFHGFRISSKEFIESWGDKPITGLSHKEDNKLISAIQAAGSRGTIKVRCGDSPNKEISDSCIFELSTPDGFFSNSGCITLPQARILIYEGAINDISQIHHILEQASNPVKGLVIFATSFSNDVAYTLAKNLELKKLNVIPVTILDGVENVNDVHDLSFLTNTLPITKNNAGSLRTININEVQTLKSVKVDFTNMKLNLDIDYQIVNKLRKQILKKIQAELVEDKKNLFQKRMSRLMNHNVGVSFNTEKYLEGIIQDRVNFFIATMTSIARENALGTKDIISTKNATSLPKYIPLFSTSYAIKRASSDSDFILNTGMVIAIDNE